MGVTGMKKGLDESCKLYILVSMSESLWRMIWDASSSKENSTRHISYFHWRRWFGYLLLKMEDIVGQWWLLIAVHRKQHLNILSSLGLSEQISFIQFLGEKIESQAGE